MSDTREAKPADVCAREAELEHLDLVLDDVAAERLRQRDKGYDAAHDDAHSLNELGSLICAQTWAPEDDDDDLTVMRKAFVCAAAVAVAAVESIDRRMAVLAKARTPDDRSGSPGSHTEGPWDRTGTPRPVEG